LCSSGRNKRQESDGMFEKKSKYFRAAAEYAKHKQTMLLRENVTLLIDTP
jgi:hypothetical protein